MDQKIDKQEFSVVVTNKNGIRYGKFNVVGVDGDFPRQAMTSSNINHLRTAGNRGVNFNTKFLEIYFRKDLSALDTTAKIKSEAAELKKVIDDNPDKLCLLLIPSPKSRRFSKGINATFVRLQIEAGFKLIKVWIKDDKDTLADLKYYMGIVPDGRFLLPVLDEKLKTSTFKEVYEYALGKVPVIGFLGRDLSKKDTNIGNNYNFVRNRKTDKVVRLVSETNKRTKDGMVKSLLYYFLGYDVFTFATRKSRYTIMRHPLQVIKGFRYENLSDNMDLECEIRPGKKLADTVEIFRADKKETVPCSIFSLAQLNREFRNIQNTMTEKELETALKESIKEFF